MDRHDDCGLRGPLGPPIVLGSGARPRQQPAQKQRPEVLAQADHLGFGAGAELAIAHPAQPLIDETGFSFGRNLERSEVAWLDAVFEETRDQSSRNEVVTAVDRSSTPRPRRHEPGFFHRGQLFDGEPRSICQLLACEFQLVVGGAQRVDAWQRRRFSQRCQIVVGEVAGTQAFANDAQRHELIALLAQDPAQLGNVAVVIAPIAGVGALGTYEALRFEKAKFRDRDVGKIDLQQLDHLAYRAIRTHGHRLASVLASEEHQFELADLEDVAIVEGAGFVELVLVDVGAIEAADVSNMDDLAVELRLRVAA